MAEVSGQNFTSTKAASGDISGSQFTYVRQLAGVNADVLTISASGVQVPFGILQNKPRDNEFATMVVMGHSKVRLANSLGANIWLMSGQSGWAVQYAAASGGVSTGRLITGATSGALGETLFNPTFVGSASIS